MTLREEELAHSIARLEWPPNVDISNRDYARILDAGQIPQERAAEFRQVLLDAHANAWNAARGVKLMPTKKQYLKVLCDAETKFRSFRQSLKDDNFMLLGLLAHLDVRNAVLAGKTDGSTLRSLTAESARDLDGLDRIGDRIAAMIADADAMPEHEGSNNNRPFERHLMHSLESYWREVLGREIDGTQQCQFRLLMHAVFLYVAGDAVSPEAMTKRLNAQLAGK